MGRPSHSRALSVWMNGQRVGVWVLNRNAEHSLQYDKEWMNSAAGRPLSLSLPFIGDNAIRGERVGNYFDNLLPDSDTIRLRLATRFKTQGTDAFNLLQAIGRDCVGAVQLLGSDEIPMDVHQINGKALSESEIEALLIRTPHNNVFSNLDLQEELRISLGGAQEKTALLWHQGRWMQAEGSTPTTHILKLPIGMVGHRNVDFSTSVENEWLCMNLLEAFGLPVAKTEILTFASQKVLCVERFDRQMHSSGNWIMRLPQEDFCQILGVPSHMKYENDGGPGLADIASVLIKSSQASVDIITLLKAQLLFWLLSAPDGHAKNFSVRLLPQGRYQLTPLYDVMSILPVQGNGPNQFSIFKAKMAMAITGKNKHYLFKDIQRKHFNHLARKHFELRDAEDVICHVLDTVPLAIEKMKNKIPNGFPNWVAESVFNGLKNSAQLMGTMPKN